MDAVIKVGGSLAENPEALKALGFVLSGAAKKHRLVVVPGGGRFADAVRELDAKFGLPAVVSHRMAIFAMDQYGLLLSQVFPVAVACDSLGEALALAEKGKLAVFLPSKLLLQGDPFSPSWEVTSDSIAAYIAVRLGATKAVFVTDVDGIYTDDPKRCADAALLSSVSVSELQKMGKRTSVDKFLPQFLLQNWLECCVVNGNYPERVEAALSNHQTVCTKITRGQ
ncbi:MAG: delta 1-pyrroline-5-carboxylate synthetase [Candidatus Bathyarchaeota archaeon]|nr:delta 1-pyrroline-5-carboxylate synthetase [Candidatus Bathyarchaeota archaeon]